MDKDVIQQLLVDKALIFTYIYNFKTHKKAGLLVSWKINQKVHLSYSLLNPGDKFDLPLGIFEAINKVGQKTYLLSENKAFEIDKRLPYFLRRVIQYFKVSDIEMHLPIIKRS